MADQAVVNSSHNSRVPRSSDGGAIGSDRQAQPGRRGARGPASLPSTQKRVRTPELALGLLLAAGCGLGAVAWTASASSTTPALVLARDVKRGDVLVATDFAPAEARATGLRLVAYTELDSFVGRIAAIDMPVATPLSDSVALEIAPIADGEALVAIRVAAGSYPTGLRAGSTVELVGLTPPAQLVADAQPGGGTESNPLEIVSTDAGADATPLSATTPATALPPLIVVVDSIELVPSAADEIVVTVRVPRAHAAAVASQSSLRLVEVAG
jgi:hypothetical protein